MKIDRINYYLMIIFLSHLKLVLGGIHQRRLLAKLFKDYQPWERPVENETENLRVDIALSIQQIVDLDEKKQTIIFSGWLDMTWKDVNLKWNPNDFGNISFIRVPSSKIWIPDLLLYNSADVFETKANVNAVLGYDGIVNFLPPGMFKSTCQIEIYHFPFDVQSCSLKFGSWTYDESTIDLQNKSDTAQLDSYIENGEWLLRRVTSYSESLKYECCPENYPFVMFVIHLKRRTLYFIFNLVFPCVFISFMSILGFALPPDSGEKIALEITTLLSIIFFLQLLRESIPESSLSVPKLAMYFASVMVISTLSILANVFVLSLHHKNVKIQPPMPFWVERWICGYLAKLLRMHKPYRLLNSKTPSTKYMQYNGFHDVKSKKLLPNILSDDLSIDINELKASHRKLLSGIMVKQNSSMNEPMEKVYLSASCSNSLKRNQKSNISICENCNNVMLVNNKNELNSLNDWLMRILKELEILTSKTKQDLDDEHKKLNWKFAAMVIDRLCMILFALATFVSTFTFSLNLFYTFE